MEHQEAHIEVTSHSLTLRNDQEYIDYIALWIRSLAQSVSECAQFGAYIVADPILRPGFEALGSLLQAPFMALHPQRIETC